MPTPTLPMGINALNMAQRASHKFTAAGGRDLPKHDSRPEMEEKLRAVGFVREQVLADAWRNAQVEMIDEMHLMLRHLCTRPTPDLSLIDAAAPGAQAFANRVKRNVLAELKEECLDSGILERSGVVEKIETMLSEPYRIQVTDHDG